MVAQLQQEREADVTALTRQFKETKQSLAETDSLLKTHKEDLMMV